MLVFFIKLEDLIDLKTSLGDQTTSVPQNTKFEATDNCKDYKTVK